MSLRDRISHSNRPIFHDLPRQLQSHAGIDLLEDHVGEGGAGGGAGSSWSITLPLADLSSTPNPSSLHPLQSGNMLTDWIDDAAMFTQISHGHIQFHPLHTHHPALFGSQDSSSASASSSQRHRMPLFVDAAMRAAGEMERAEVDFPAGPFHRDRKVSMLFDDEASRSSSQKLSEEEQQYAIPDPFDDMTNLIPAQDHFDDDALAPPAVDLLEIEIDQFQPSEHSQPSTAHDSQRPEDEFIPLLSEMIPQTARSRNRKWSGEDDATEIPDHVFATWLADIKSSTRDPLTPESSLLQRRVAQARMPIDAELLLASLAPRLRGMLADFASITAWSQDSYNNEDVSLIARTQHNTENVGLQPATDAPFDEFAQFETQMDFEDGFRMEDGVDGLQQEKRQEQDGSPHLNFPDLTPPSDASAPPHPILALIHQLAPTDDEPVEPLSERQNSDASQVDGDQSQPDAADPPPADDTRMSPEDMIQEGSNEENGEDAVSSKSAAKSASASSRSKSTQPKLTFTMLVQHMSQTATLPPRRLAARLLHNVLVLCSRNQIRLIQPTSYDSIVIDPVR
jgi:hypothetical protein